MIPDLAKSQGKTAVNRWTGQHARIVDVFTFVGNRVYSVRLSFADGTRLGLWLRDFEKDWTIARDEQPAGTILLNLRRPPGHGLRVIDPTATPASIVTLQIYRYQRQALRRRSL